MNNRRRLTGVVTSNKMTKTVVVEIARTFRHPLYRKVVHLSKRVKAHDEIGCQIGDQVQIVETRPLSHEKRWVVESVVTRETRTQDAGGVAAMSGDVEPEVLTPSSAPRADESAASVESSEAGEAEA
jgi:small subunit ribosomal protein S17